MAVVLDACALLAYLQAEPGGEIIQATLTGGTDVCYAHAVNLCEVYYHAIRQQSQAVAVQIIGDLLNDGVQPREDMDEAFWKEVGHLKARGGIALADCFCVALASRLSCEILTSDHTEFDPIAAGGLCAVRFIR